MLRSASTLVKGFFPSALPASEGRKEQAGEQTVGTAGGTGAVDASFLCHQTMLSETALASGARLIESGFFFRVVLGVDAGIFDSVLQTGASVTAALCNSLAR